MAILPLSQPILEQMLAHLRSLVHHLASLVRHLGASMCKSAPQNAIFEPTSAKTAPEKPQPPLPSTPKVQKTEENLKFLNVFYSPVMVPKSTKNAPRITSEATKMAVLPLSWSISELMLSHLGSPAHHLASLVRHLGANMCNNLKQKAFGETTSAKTAPRCLSHTFPAPQKYKKPKKT